MTQQTTLMYFLTNSPVVRDSAGALGWFDVDTALAALAQRIRLGFTAAVLAMQRWVHASTLTLSAERLAAPPRSADGQETLARFQREIVPQLDAAYNFARFLSRDPDAAQDIVQEAFLRAYRGFAGYQGGDARAWIFAIVRNCYHNWLLDRRRKTAHEIDVHDKDDGQENAIDNVASDEDSPETTLLRRAESGAVRLVLNRLPRPLREILVLRELEGLSYRQIADIAALPIGTVMSRLARARTRFEAAWRRENAEVTPAAALASGQQEKTT